MTEKHIRLGELFCGPGGIGYGAKSACVKVFDSEITIKAEWATDKDKDTCETYNKNVADVAVCKDVIDVNFSDLNKIDALSFGFPCNDFSLVGEQKGVNGKFGPLYKECVRAIVETNPMWFIAENVGGLKSANKGKAMAKILNSLKGAGKGYNITPHFYKFEEYGVPQCRHRIIIVGIRNDIDATFKVPKPTHLEKFVTVKDILETNPIKDDALNNEPTRQSKTVVRRLDHIKPGENAWTADIPEEYQLNVKGAKLSQIYKRLDPDKPAYTVTGSGGGGTHVYHYSDSRALTNRERARLQTFPDEYDFHGSKESVRKQIGMAVPPLAAKVIIEAVIKTLNKIDYESVSPNMECATDILENDLQTV